MSDQGTCQPCPMGVKCQDGRVPLLNPGYMTMPGASMSAVPLQLYMCGSEVRCPGQKSVEDQVCADLMEGMNCGLCQEGYYLEGDECKLCNKGSAFSMPLSALVAMALSGFFLWSWNRKAAHVEAAESVLASVTFGITLAFLQTLGVFGALEMNWPPLILVPLTTIRSILFDISTLLGMPCMFHGNFQAPYIFNLLTPLSIVFFFSTWYFIFRLLHWATTGKVQSFDVNQVANSVGMVVQGIYVSFVFATVAMLECFESAPGTKVLRRYPFVECGSGDHTALIPAIVLAFLVYVVGILGTFTYMCWVAPNQYQNSGFRSRVRFLVFKYHPSYWWYGLMLTIRSLLLGLVSVVAPTSGYQQFFIMMFILISSLVMHLTFLPYSDLYANLLETVELGLLIAMLAIASWFIEDPDRGSAETSKILQVLLLIICIGCFFFVFLIFSYAMARAIWPQFLQGGKQREVCRLMPRIRTTCRGIQLLDDTKLEKLLLDATYRDRKNLSLLVSWILLETSGVSSEKLSERRLSLENKNIVMNADGSEVVQRSSSLKFQTVAIAARGLTRASTRGLSRASTRGLSRASTTVTSLIQVRPEGSSKRSARSGSEGASASASDFAGVLPGAVPDSVENKEEKNKKSVAEEDNLVMEDAVEIP